MDYGDATIIRGLDGKPYVERADAVIGISTQLLADADEHLPVDSEGCVWLAGDHRYRYRPVRFESGSGVPGGPCQVVVCERVT